MLLARAVLFAGRHRLGGIIGLPDFLQALWFQKVHNLKLPLDVFLFMSLNVVL